jgi:hypothetical protein
MSASKKARPAGLTEALLEAQRAVGGIGKDARNDFGRYDYVSAEAMIRGARVALHHAGLAFFASGTEIVAEGQSVQVTYRLSHPGSGQELVFARDWPISRDLGKGKTKPEDKALAGALTACLSYTLRGLLLIPRVDPSEEMDVGDRQEDPREDLIELGRVAKAAMEGQLWTAAQLKELKATTSAAKGDTMTRAEVARLIKTITTTIGSEYAKETA